ncbi:MAG: hypothetical protein SX243_06340 [Acidobacteriota bacterium]|nr:hypothetical protein [Acidobacteriota bacterium]
MVESTIHPSVLRHGFLDSKLPIHFQPLEKVGVMGDGDKTSLVALAANEVQNRLAIVDVEVVGRFVEEDQGLPVAERPHQPETLNLTP